MNKRLGVCCLVLGSNASEFKTLQLKRTQQEANPQEKIFSVYRHNLNELVKVLNYLASVNIWHYRISSDMFPLADHPEFQSYWNDFCSKDWFWIPARLAVQNYLSLGGRLSTHPDQFCIISSSKPEVNDKGILNLEYHAKMFDMLQIPQSYFFPINIHVSNGKLEQQAAQNTINNLPRLSQSVLSRLVFETEDKSYWTYQRLSEHFPNIPITIIT
jgi:UV DNA damage endonuclease